MIQLTGLWINETKAGETYFSGNIGSAKVLIFKNNNKVEGSKQPDYNLVLAENKKKEPEEKKTEVPF